MNDATTRAAISIQTTAPLRRREGAIAARSESNWSPISMAAAYGRVGERPSSAQSAGQPNAVGRAAFDPVFIRQQGL